MALRVFWILSALIATGVVAWGWALTRQSDDESQVQSALVATSFAPPVANQIISPLPQNPRQLRLDGRKVELGRKLFHDKRLSHDDSIACASCHPLNKMGVDGLPLSPGIKQQFGQLNTPTVFNTGFNFRQFWDGRAADLEEQASGPVHNPVEMASNWPEVIAKLKQDAYYPKAFRAIWPDGIQPQHIQSAIAEFERGLITPDSPFDRYLRGESNALSEEAQRGWSLFRNLGCVACHQGINVGGNMYANLGVMGDFFEDRGIPETEADQGRFNVTKRPEDRHLFKVPSLRNVARTAPYFHDGSIATLDKAIDTMARYQLGVMHKKLALAVVLATLPSVILIPGVAGHVSWHESVRARLENLEIAESRFNELVIGLRHGISNNYDEANNWLMRMQENQAALAKQITDDSDLQRHWQLYQKSIQRQDELWNDFKRRNSLVRNSLRYFQKDALKAASSLENNAPGRALQLDLMALNNALFMQALSEEREAGEEAQALLARTREQITSQPLQVQSTFALLLKHADIIIHNSPGLANDTRGLVHGADREALNALASANHALLIAGQKQASLFRLGLLASVVILILALTLLLTRYLGSLRASAREHRLAGTVFTRSQQGIIITDSHGSIVQVNPAHCQITGYSEAELIGKNPRMFQSGEQSPAFYQQMWSSLNSAGHWQGELKNRRKNGDVYAQWINIDAVTTTEGEQLYVGIATDISELVRTQERLASLAYYDTLTGLPNRVLFQDRLSQAMINAHREHESMALIFCDLDNFKVVNDSLGHAIGDDLLRVVAERLKACVRESDTVARLGGDEFAIILNDAKGADEMARLARNIIVSLAEPCHLQGAELSSGASLGITFYPSDAQTEDELLKNADVAMYRAKERGRNDFQFFTGDMAATVADNMRIEYGLRHALEAGELSLHYQPQICSTGQLVGAEALMRWHSPELGHVPPARFIPVAEKCGLIGALGDFALHEASRQCAQWRQQLGLDFRMAINLSAAQFRNESLPTQVAAALHEFNLPGASLELEITESVVMEDVAAGQEVLQRLKYLGCHIAIDDFGTGNSSLAYLKHFHVDVLKLDKSFVDGLGTDNKDSDEDTAVAQAVISLAQSLRLQLVAEGVETQAQLSCLDGLTGESEFIVQGYLFSPPVPADQFPARIGEIHATHFAGSIFQTRPTG